MLSCIMLHYIIQYYFILCYIVLYCTIYYVVLCIIKDKVAVCLCRHAF